MRSLGRREEGAESMVYLASCDCAAKTEVTDGRHKWRDRVHTAKRSERGVSRNVERTTNRDRAGKTCRPRRERPAGSPMHAGNGGKKIQYLAFGSPPHPDPFLPHTRYLTSETPSNGEAAPALVPEQQASMANETETLAPPDKFSGERSTCPVEEAAE